MAKHVVVIGAGLGGLSAALRLAHLGHQVTVLERTDQIGGRNRRLSIGASRFDAGPTLVMMLAPFRRLFEDVGERLEDHLDLIRCEPSYRVFFSDGARVDATADLVGMRQEIARLAPGDAEALPRFHQDLAALYRDAIPNFVERNFNSAADFFGPDTIRHALRHGMLGNLHKRVARYFEDPRTQMLFSFQAMYLGLSPFEAPWVYSTLTHMELAEGIYYFRGGVASLSERIGALAVRKGAKIRLSTEACAIERDTVRTTSGESIRADAILCNADLPYARAELEHRPVPKSWKYSCSALMLYLDYRGSIPELLHHNVFFSSDYRKTFKDIFTDLQIPADPAFYVCASSKTDPEQTTRGNENLMILIPCPNLNRPWRPDDHQSLRSAVFARLAAETSFRSEQIAAEGSMSPIDWQDQLNLAKGAAFGLSHHLRQSAYFRPANRSKTNPFLYFAGASTVPGNGMPMVLISAELAVERMQRDRLI